MTNYDLFREKLHEIFMMDHAELDFGIYRIMNQKRDDITRFLEKDLLPQVKEVLSSAGNGAIQEDLDKAIQQCQALEMNPDENPKVIRLRQQLAQAGNTEEVENLVFSHLTKFFSRYYDNGDFVSKRRYKDNAYAIPYNGEEVKLHWANADQYYIKSSEYFRDYTFVLPESRRKVHFVLKDATTEQNNNKASNNMERRFAIYNGEGEPCFEIKGDELNIFFTYELKPKATKQKELNAEALGKIMEIVPDAFNELLNVKSPTKDNANRTLLEKHLTDYTAKNSFDYFIHKDLGGFLHRELDFYIKNEVMFLDDLDAAHIQSQLTIIKAIKQVGDKIIRMLAQLENFQKRLWLKKKFIVQSDYCITIDRVPEELYDDIIANDRQREEWVRLFAIDEIKGDLTTEAYSVPLTMEFLKQNPFLVLDTAFFDAKFKHQLVRHLGEKGIDEQCNGLLINSENFQALELLQEKYRKSIKTTYIDPPYNAKSSEILYKNTFKHSSWMSLMHDRLLLAQKLNSEDFVYTIAIDEIEQENLGYILSDIYSDNKKICLSMVHNPRGQQGKNVSYIHEFAFMIYPNDQSKYLADIKRDVVDSRNLRDSGTESDRTDAKTCFYPILVKENEVIGFGGVPSDDFHPSSPNIYHPDGTIEVWPIDQNMNEKKWRYGRETVPQIQKKLEPKNTSSIQIIFNQDMGVMKSLWNGAQYDASEYGTKVLQNILGIEESKKFTYPKSINTVVDCTNIAFNSENGICLDYFGGSGTTAHAIIKQNREQKTNRRYILCEMGLYFDSVTRARTQKVIYSDAWRDGRPVSRQGISQCFKYIRLEQYEDTLNNLQLKEQDNMLIFGGNSDFKESYMLGYMLDTETRDSLLNLKMFENPFAMTLKTTKDNELVETNVDMVETFNYLIGLNVETEDWYKDDNICVLQGRTHRDNLKTLVIWRNCENISNDQLNDFFERMDFRTRDSEFDVIYVNGDNTLPNLRRDDDHWKVVLTEEEFQRKMFEDC